MTEESSERRHGIDEFIEKLNDVELDVAVIKADNIRQAGTRRIIWGMAAMLFIQIIAAAVGYGKIQTKLDHIDLSKLEREMTTSLTVLADHGSELKAVRDEQFRVRGMMDDMRVQFQSELTTRTADRFYKTDWTSSKLWIDEKFGNVQLRLKHLEQEHHSGEVK
jgi:hypothetical protein